MIYVVAWAAVIATILGGLFAIRFRDKLHLILGFSAGAVLAVALFDLIPEAIDLTAGTHNLQTVSLFIAGGFVAYLLLDRLFSLHTHEQENCCKPNHKGELSAMTLILHSYLDGLGIGLAFQVSPTVGWIVAAAVLTHDFSDGINTVGMILKGKEDRRKAFKWLVADALAPAVGVISTTYFSVSGPTLGIILAVFAGLFLYLGASDLIPESHHRHPTIWTTIMTISGMAVLFLAIRLAS